MLLRKLTSLRRIRALLALTLLLMTSAQALASALRCAEQVAMQDMAALQQMMSTQHNGHDMPAMDTGTTADCCNHDCECPATACSSAAAIAADSFSPIFGATAEMFPGAISVAITPPFNSPFRPPIST